MTISSTTRKAGPLPGNGVTTIFPFAFKVFSKTDLVVVLTTIASGVEITLTVDVDYTVALNADQDATPGGTITYNPLGVPMPATMELTITSNVPLLQTLALTIGGGFSPSAIMAALDRAIICLQQVTLTIAGALRVSISDTTPGVLPAKAARANMLLGFDNNGDPIASAGGASTPVSAAMAPVVSAATLAAAQAVLTAAGFTSVGALLASAGFTAAQAVTFSGVVSPAQITADQNDYTPANLAVATMLRINSDAARNVTGLSGGSSGRLMALRNIGGFAITLKDEAAGSTAANRFALSADYVLGVDQSVLLEYDSTSSRWTVFGQQNTASVVSGTDSTRNLKAISTDPVQGTWVNGTTTYAAVASGYYDLDTLTNGDGHIVSDVAQFGAVTYVIQQATTGGAPVYAYEYWNGAWTALGGVSAPTFTAFGVTQLRFTVPGDWVVGGSGTGVPAGSFNIRVRATTAPGTLRVRGRAYLANKSTATADEMILSKVDGTKIRHAAASITPDIRVAGSAANGRDQAGAFGANTWIYKWAISDGTTLAGLWSASATAPTMPGAYVYKLLLGAWRVDANSVLMLMQQFGARAKFSAYVTDVNASTAIVVTAGTATIPPEAVEWQLRVDHTGGGNLVTVDDKPFPKSGTNDTTTDAQFCGGTNAVAAGANSGFLKMANGNAFYYTASAATSYSIRTQGWTFPGNLG